MPGVNQIGSAQFGQILYEIIPKEGLVLISSDGVVVIEMHRLAYGDRLEDIDETVISNDLIVKDPSWKYYSNYNVTFDLQPQSIVEEFKSFAWNERGKIITLKVPNYYEFRALLDAETVEIIRTNELDGTCGENYEATISFNVFVLGEILESPECQ